MDRKKLNIRNKIKIILIMILCHKCQAKSLNFSHEFIQTPTIVTLV